MPQNKKRISSDLDLHLWLFLEWNDRINKSGLVRDAVKSEMRKEGIDTARAREVVQQALQNHNGVEELKQSYANYNDLSSELTNDPNRN
jgi:hypothetical protein